MIPNPTGANAWRVCTLFLLGTLFSLLLGLDLLARPARAASINHDHQTVRTQATPTPMAVNLTVSVEFTPSTASLLSYTPPAPLPPCTMSLPPNTPYIADLMVGLCRASSYIAAASGGQFQLGQVTIYAGGEQWANADIRIRADAGYRPSAAVGGVVSAPTVFTPPVQSLAPITYTPGVISLGRCWSGNNASCYNGVTYSPNWSAAAGYQVLGHELGHYLWTLFDEYTEDNNPAWDPVQCERSLMANPYTIAELWHTPAQLDEGCRQHNEQWRFTHLSDWQRIDAGVRLLFAQQATTPPAGPPVITYVAPTGAPNAVSEPRLQLTVTGVITQPLAQLEPQIYWKAMNGNMPVQILYQGSSTARSQANPLGETLLFAPPATNAQLHAYVHSQSGQRFRYSGLIPAASQGAIALTAEPFHADLNVHYGMTGETMTALTATLQMPDLVAFAPQFYLCTPGQLCRSALVTATVNAGHLQAVFNASQFNEPNGFPQYGVLYIRLNNGKEVLRWFERLNGVRQGRMRAHAPLLDGRVNIQSLADPDNLLPGALPSQALMMPATLSGMLEQPLPTGISGLVDLPLDLDVAPGVTSVGDRSLAAPIVVTFFYDPEQLQRLGVAADKLTVVHFDRGSNRWCIANRPNLALVTNVRLHVNRAISSAPMLVDGVYALAWGANPANAGYPAGSLCHTQNPTIPPDLELTKYTEATAIRPGEKFHYELLVRNSGAGAAPGPIVVTDLLPPPLTANGTWTLADNWTCTVNQNQITCTRPGALPPGYEITLSLPVAVGSAWPDGTAVTNCATVTAPNAKERYFKNNESCHSLPLPLPDLGDAPDSTNHSVLAMAAYNGVVATFPTVYGDPAGVPGPSHRFPTLDAWLGSTVSGELDADLAPDEDGLANLDPAGQVADRDQGDDGVNSAAILLPTCGRTSLTYHLRVVGPARPRYTNVWFDFNRDGDWRDVFTCRVGSVSYTVREWAVVDHATTFGPGTYAVTPTFVAITPMRSQDLWMRISVSEQRAVIPAGSTAADGRGPAGGYIYGETEDYRLRIVGAAQAMNGDIVEISELDPATTPPPLASTDQETVPVETVPGDAMRNTLYLPLIVQE